MNTSTLSTPRVVCYPSPEHALVAHLIAADEQHGTRLLIKQTREYSAWLGDSAVMQSFRDNRLEDLAKQSLVGNHTPLQGAALNAMLANLNWTTVAEELLSHFTPDRIAELDAAAVDLVAQELEEYASLSGTTIDVEDVRRGAAIFSGVRHRPAAAYV